MEADEGVIFCAAHTADAAPIGATAARAVGTAQPPPHAVSDAAANASTHSRAHAAAVAPPDPVAVAAANAAPDALAGGDAASDGLRDAVTFARADAQPDDRSDHFGYGGRRSGSERARER